MVWLRICKVLESLSPLLSLSLRNDHVQWHDRFFDQRIGPPSLGMPNSVFLTRIGCKDSFYERAAACLRGSHAAPSWLLLTHC